MNSVKELIALAKAKPGVLNYGSGGSGGSLHQGGEMFIMIAGVDIRRVPYKSTGPALTKRLNQEIVRIMAQPDVKAQLFAGGSEAVSSTPQQIEAKLAADDAKLRKLFAAIGLEPSK